MIKLKSLIKNLLRESFEKVSDLIADPKNDQKYFNDVKKEFEDAGGKTIGNGRSGTVYSHPAWNFVLKTFKDDVPYLKFVRFVLKNPRKSFPKFLDKPRFIYPNYKRHKSEQGLYYVKIEMLEPISQQEFDDISFYLYYGNYDFSNAPKNETWVGIEKKINSLEQKYTDIKTFKKDHDFLFSSDTELGTYDIGKSNIMKRQNGEFVLSDPVWEGETPYQTYDRLVNSEIGDRDEDMYAKETDWVSGGKRWKKTKPKKYTHTKDDLVLPF